MHYAGGRFFAAIVTTILITAATVLNLCPATASAAVRGPVLSAGTRHDLLQLYAAYRHLPVADIARTVPGSARAARRPVSGTEWAALSFQPAAGVPQAVAASFQDGAGTGVFTRAAGSSRWKMNGLGGEPLGCEARVPAIVRTRWRLPACPVSSPPTRRASPGIPASGAAGIAAIAASAVGVSDDPAETGFGGLDCNPYRARSALGQHRRLRHRRQIRRQVRQRAVVRGLRQVGVGPGRRDQRPGRADSGGRFLLDLGQGPR